MADTNETWQTWRRIERRDASGAVVDWVEVGRCAGCGRGVDREFPGEYRTVGDVLYCRECAGRLPRRATLGTASAPYRTEGGRSCLP